MMELDIYNDGMAIELQMIRGNHPTVYASSLFVAIGNVSGVQDNEAIYWPHKT